MNFSSIYYTNKRQFTKSLQREKITVTDYWDRTKTYEVFFRREERNTTPESKLRFYYAQSTPIKMGTTFLLKGVPYLVISQDGIESDIYYTSLAVQCDMYFDIYYNRKYHHVPCRVLEDLYTVYNGSVFNIVSGSVTFYAGDNKYTEAISVNDEFGKFGNYYKIGNRFFNNGLAYFYAEQKAKPADEYKLVYGGSTVFDISSTKTYQLSYTAVLNNSIDDNPDIVYSSSNEEIAKVDDKGLLTIVNTGTVTITAVWKDGKNTQCQTFLNILGEPVSTVLSEITAPTDRIIVGGGYVTFTITFYDEDGNDVTSDYAEYTYTWSCSVGSEDLTDTVTWLDGNNFNQMEIKFSDDTSYLGKVLTVKCKAGNIVTAQVVNIRNSY